MRFLAIIFRFRCLILLGGWLVTGIGLAGCQPAEGQVAAAAGSPVRPSETAPSAAVGIVSPATPATSYFSTSTLTPPIGPRGQLAYVGTDESLWLLDLATGRPEQLTQDEQVLSPAWSGDGTQLAYTRKTPDGRQREIMLLDVAKRQARVVAAFRDPAIAEVYWTPGGRHLAADVGCCASGRKLVLLDSAGREVQRMFPYTLAAKWSPGGRYLALGRPVELARPIAIEDGRSSSVVALDVVAGTEQVLAQGTSEAIYFPVCWLTETSLVYRKILWAASQQADTQQVWQVTTDHPSNPNQVAAELPWACAPPDLGAKLPGLAANGYGLDTVSPDGHWAVVSADQNGSHLLYLVEIPTLAYRRIAEGNQAAWRPLLPVVSARCVHCS